MLHTAYAHALFELTPLHHLNLRRVCKPSANTITSISSLEKWGRLYRQGGAEALRPKKKGRPGGSVASEQPKTREQELEDRVRYLEAENAYLKN